MRGNARTVPVILPLFSIACFGFGGAPPVISESGRRGRQILPIGFAVRGCLYVCTMKIEGPNKTAGVKGASKSGRRADGDSSFSALIDSGDEASGASGASAPA